MKHLLIVLFLVVSNNLVAQEYTWMEGVCTYTGQINAQLTNEKQLDNIVGLLMNTGTFNQPVFMTKLKDSTFIQASKVKREYEIAIKELESAEFPKASVWDSIRTIRLNYLKREMELKLLGVEAMTNPSVLKTDKKTAKICKSTIKILCSSPSEILKAYRKIYGEKEYQRLVNLGYSETLMAKAASNDLLRFEWYNSAITTLTPPNYNSVINQELKKLMTSIKTDCK